MNAVRRSCAAARAGSRSPTWCCTATAPVRRDELIDALWAHEGAPPSDTALAPVLSRLRRAIEPGDARGPRHAAARLSRSRCGSTSRRSGRPGRRRATADAAREAARRSPSPGCCPTSTRRGCGEPRDDLEELRDRGAGARRRAGCARRRRAAGAERAARAAVAAGAVPRVRARGADRGADRARQPRRGDARLRRAARAAARGARDDARAGARRAARAAARAAAGAAPARAPPGCSSATPSWPRSPPRWRGCAPARAACSPSRGRRGSARRGCSASCASARCEAGAEVLDARAGRARARVRLRRRAPALRGGGRDASRRPAGARSVFGEGAAPRRPVRRAQRALPATSATLAAAPPARALHRRPAVERHRLAALRRLPRAPHRRAAGARRRRRSAPASPTPTSCCSASSARTRRPSPSSRGR